MPRQLLITVRQDADVDRSRSAAEVSGSVGGDQGRVTVPGSRDPRGGSVVLRDGDDRVRVQVLEGSGSESDRNTQAVRVMEGREAFVRVGQSVPVRERQVQRSVVGGQVVEQVVETTQYRDAATGFYVLPRVAGDRVTLDISPQRETLSRQAPRRSERAERGDDRLRPARRVDGDRRHRQDTSGQQIGLARARHHHVTRQPARAGQGRGSALGICAACDPTNS